MSYAPIISAHNPSVGDVLSLFDRNTACKFAILLYAVGSHGVELDAVGTIYHKHTTISTAKVIEKRDKKMHVANPSLHFS